MVFNIYTWGDADTLAKVLNAISKVFDNGDVQLFITTLFIISGSVFIVKAFISGKDTLGSIWMFFIGTMAIFILFTKVKYDANIINERTGSAAIVSDVPAPVVLTAYFFSAFEKVLMNVISTSFQTPSGINYENAGYNASAALFASLPKLTISDPYFRRNFNEFIYSCFFEDILRKNKDFGTLSTVNNIWEYLRPIAPVYTYYYSNTDPSGTLKSCLEAYNSLDGVMTRYSTLQVNNMLSSLLGINLSSFDLVKRSFTDFLGQTTNNSNLEVFKNTISARYIFDTLQYAATDSMVSSDVRAYAEQVAKNNIFRGWEIGGNNAREILPIVKSIIQLMLFAFFPFLLMMVFTPMRWMYIKMFLVLFFWLSLWDPLYALATYVSNLRLEDLLSGVSYGQGYTLSTMGKIFEQAMAHLEIWNYFALVVPVLAFALAKASEHAMVSFVGNIASAIGSGGATVGTQVASPQGSGHLMGEAKEISKYGSDLAFNRVADNTLFGAEKGLGSAIANRVLSSIDPYGVVRASANKEFRDNSHTYNLKDPYEVGFAQAIKDAVMSNRIKEGVKQYGGDISKYVHSLAKEGAIKDVSQAEAFLGAIDKVFGDGDGKLSEKEIDNYADFVKNKALFDNKETFEKLKDLAGFFKQQGYEGDKAFMMAATFIGKGESARMLMHSVKNKANLDALMEVSGYDLSKAYDIFKRGKVVDFASMAGKTDELIRAGRQIFGKEAGNWSDTKVLNELSKIFGVNEAQKEIFENAKWDAFRNELLDSKDTSGFVNKLVSFAGLEGTLDAAAKKGLMKVADSIGIDNLKQLVSTKTGGNFVRDIVEGMKNDKVIRALGEGDYEKGIERYAQIMADKESGEALKTEQYLNELADYYQKENKELSRAEALAMAYKDLGTIHAYSDEGKLKALDVLDKELAKAYAAGEVYKVGKALGYINQAGDYSQLKQFSRESGMHDISHAKALKQLSGLLEKLGFNEREANDIYQFLKEGSSMMHHLSSLGKIGAFMAGSYLLNKFGDRVKEHFKGLENLEKLKNSTGEFPPSSKSVKAEKAVMDTAKSVALDSIDNELVDINNKLKNTPDGSVRDELLKRRDALIEYRDKIQSLNMNIASDRAKLFDIVTNDEKFLNSFEKGLDIREKVSNRYLKTLDALNSAYGEFVNGIYDKLKASGAPEGVIERFKELTENVDKYRTDPKAREEFVKHLQNLMDEGYITSKDLNNIIDTTFKSVSQKDAIAGKVIKETFEESFPKGVKGFAIKSSSAIAKGIFALADPLALGFMVVDYGVGLVTGKTITDRAVDKVEDVLSYRIGDDAKNHISKLSKNISSFYGSSYDGAFMANVTLMSRTPLQAFGANLGYSPDDFGSVANFQARYADALYSYLNENYETYMVDGKLNINKAARDLNKILNDVSNEEHDKYAAYFKDGNTNLIHPNKISGSEYYDYFMGGRYN